MPQPILGPAGVTVQTPPSFKIYHQVVQLDTSAGDATGFAAFVLPKGSIPILALIVSSGANVAQTLNVGTTLGGTQLINAATCNGAQVAVVGTAVGAQMGALQTADTLYYAKASAQLTNAVKIVISYYFPQQGMTW